jgi:pre-rRNA-processing protein TSR3
MSQDDPKKCSARKLSRMGLALLVESPRKLPHGAILLDPFSGIALSPADKGAVMGRGLVAIDCSWDKAEETFPRVRKESRLEGRTLPMLLAANPTKFGKWGELSTLEAIAATYYIIGQKELSKRLLSIYTWGIRFLETNREPLEAYSNCSSGEEVVRVQTEFY